MEKETKIKLLQGAIGTLKYFFFSYNPKYFYSVFLPSLVNGSPFL